MFKDVIGHDTAKEDLKDKKLYIEVAKTKYIVEIQDKPLNQKNLRAKVKSININ